MRAAIRAAGRATTGGRPYDAHEGRQTLINVSIVLTEQRGWGDFDRSALTLAPLFPA